MLGCGNKDSEKILSELIIGANTKQTYKIILNEVLRDELNEAKLDKTS